MDRKLPPSRAPAHTPAPRGEGGQRGAGSSHTESPGLEPFGEASEQEPYRPRTTERGLGVRPAGEQARSTRRSFSFPSPRVDFGADPLEGDGLDAGDPVGRAALRKRVFFKPGELPHWLTRASRRDQRKESGTFLVPPRERSELPRTALSSPLARETVRGSHDEDSGAVIPHTVPHPRTATPREDTPAPSTKPKRAPRPWASLRARKVWPWVARVAAVVMAGVVLGGLASMRVGTQARARGVLSTMGEPQVIVAGVTGALTEIAVRVGDEVAAGQVIGKVSSPELEANLARRQRELVTLRAELEAEEEARDSDARQTLASLSERRSLLSRRLVLKDQEIRSRQLRLENLQRLIDQEIAAPTEALGVAAALSAATEERLGIEAELSQLSVEEAEHRRSSDHRDRFRSLRLSGAEANAREAQELLELSEVRAPIAGWIEALSVPKGAVVQPGSVIARVVSARAPREIVAFVPSDDSGFVAPGDQANVSFEGLPRSEFGTLSARVTRVSMEVAAPDQVRTLLGRVPDEPLVRVELRLLDDSRYERLVPHLRSGSPVLVRLPTVDRKLFRVVSDRVQAWFS